MNVWKDILLRFEEMVAYYRLADVFLCMSEHEGFCVPLLESMYFGIPIIAYNATAVPYTLANCGVMVNEKRYNEIAEMIHLLITDERLRKRIIAVQNERLRDFKRSKTEGELRKYIEQLNNSTETVELPLKQKFAKYPLVSIVICTYNRAHYLERCIKSLKKQNYPHFEIVVVNGPSTDETTVVLNNYPKIRVVSQEELNGLSCARNLGITASNGEIIAFIDDDAVADENWIRYLVEGYTDKSIGGVGGPVFDITGNWYQFKNGYVSKAGISSYIHENDVDYNNPEGRLFNYLMGTNASFIKDILYEVGLFDETIKYYLDETDVCVRVIKAGYKIKHIDNAIMCHEMVEGHNRKSAYDLNWSEIMKNEVYFTLKNFHGEFLSYTLRPVKSLLWWIKYFIPLYLNKDISLKQLFSIYWELVKGALRGYKNGLAQDKKERYKEEVVNESTSSKVY
jgi:glycosyltransferase involved in cell wall biosynthesis